MPENEPRGTVGIENSPNAEQLHLFIITTVVSRPTKCKDALSE